MSRKVFWNFLRANAFTTPPFSPIFMIPSHNDSNPVNPSEISNPVLAELNVESMIAWNTLASPMHSLTTATTKAIRKNEIQIQFNTITSQIYSLLPTLTVCALVVARKAGA